MRKSRFHHLALVATSLAGLFAGPPQADAQAPASGSVARGWSDTVRRI